MNGRALKMFLALFLCVGGLIIPLTLKKSVRAVENNNYELYWLLEPTIQLESSISGSGSGYFEYQEEDSFPSILFKIDFVSNLTNQTYLKARWVWSSPTFTVLFYYTSDSWTGAPRLSISFTQINEYSAHYFRFNGISSTYSTFQSNLINILNDLQNNGFKIYNQYNGNVVPMTIPSSMWLNRIFKYGYNRDVVEGAYNEGYEDGQRVITNNPNAFDLYNLSQLQENYDSGFNTGYDSGYNAGYNLGIQADNQEAFTFTGILTNVFASAKSFLNTEIIGKLKLIHFIAIPLMLGIFAIVLKVLRG